MLAKTGCHDDRFFYTVGSVEVANLVWGCQAVVAVDGVFTQLAQPLVKLLGRGLGEPLLANGASGLTGVDVREPVDFVHLAIGVKRVVGDFVLC